VYAEFGVGLRHRRLRHRSMAARTIVLRLSDIALDHEDV